MGMKSIHNYNVYMTLLVVIYTNNIGNYNMYIHMGKYVYKFIIQYHFIYYIGMLFYIIHILLIYNIYDR